MNGDTVEAVDGMLERLGEELSDQLKEENRKLHIRNANLERELKMSVEASRLTVSRLNRSTDAVRVDRDQKKRLLEQVQAEQTEMMEKTDRELDKKEREKCAAIFGMQQRLAEYQEQWREREATAQESYKMLKRVADHAIQTNKDQGLEVQRAQQQERLALEQKRDAVKAEACARDSLERVQGELRSLKDQLNQSKQKLNRAAEEKQKALAELEGEKAAHEEQRRLLAKESGMVAQLKQQLEQTREASKKKHTTAKEEIAKLKRDLKDLTKEHHTQLRGAEEKAAGLQKQLQQQIQETLRFKHAFHAKGLEWEVECRAREEEQKESVERGRIELEAKSESSQCERRRWAAAVEEYERALAAKAEETGRVELRSKQALEAENKRAAEELADERNRSRALAEKVKILEDEKGNNPTWCEEHMADTPNSTRRTPNSTKPDNSAVFRGLHPAEEFRGPDGTLIPPPRPRLKITEALRQMSSVVPNRRVRHD
eukprot:Hpha_TRINITY_DN16438_c2_g5::TRINITY_DN16438_c2_g5_i1::g.160373::m.160373